MAGNVFIDLDISRVNTPCFIVDEDSLRKNLELLAGVKRRTGCRILLALKAFSMFSLFPLMRDYLDGVCASSPHEARLGREEFGKEVHSFAAAYSDDDFAQILRWSDHVVFNSGNQYRRFKSDVISSPGKKFGLRVNPEVSQIGTSSVTVSSGVTLPTFDERSAKTTVTVKDGETIIIGGLITNSENKSENKVPLFGDLPGIGNLFRASTRKTEKTELIIMLTPHVIRTPEEARTLSVEMRDQTGLNENIRRNPLLQGMQVKPDADQFGPVDILRPTGEQKKRSDEPVDQLGPDVEQYGPPVSTIRKDGDRPELTIRVKK